MGKLYYIIFATKEIIFSNANCLQRNFFTIFWVINKVQMSVFIFEKPVD